MFFGSFFKETHSDVSLFAPALAAQQPAASEKQPWPKFCSDRNHWLNSELGVLSLACRHTRRKHDGQKQK